MGNVSYHVIKISKYTGRQITYQNFLKNITNAYISELFL